MATFATKSEEVQKFANNKQIVQQGTTGFGGIVNAISTGAAQVVDPITTSIAKETAGEITTSALEEVERTRAAAERGSEASALATATAAAQAAQSDDPAVLGVASIAQRAAAATSAGTMTREKARLLVMNEVTKAIDEQPFLTKKIREAASNILGFNLESEGAKTFFSSFNTEAELSKASQRKLTPFEKTRDNLISSGMSSSASDKLARQLMTAENARKLLEDRAAVGNVTGGEMFNLENAADSDALDLNIISAARTLVENGETISPVLWGRVINETRDASWAQTRDRLLRNPAGAPNSSQMAQHKADFDAKYVTALETMKDFGPDVLKQEQINSNAINRTLLGDDLFRVQKFIAENIGERSLASTMEIIALGIENPAAAEALAKAQPSLAPLFKLLRENPEVLRNALLVTPQVMADPTKTAEDLPEGGEAVIDTMNQVAQTAPIEEHGNQVQNLINLGKEIQPISLVAKRSPDNVTPNSKKFFVQGWENTIATVPSKIVSEIQKGNRTLTQRGAKVSLSPGGESLIITQGRNPLTGDPFFATGHPAFEQVMKINLYLEAMRKHPAWMRELNVSDVGTMTRNLLEQVNQGLTPKFGGGMTDEQKQSRIAELEAKAGGK